MPITPITPCLWFDDKAEEAANFYVSVFENSKIKTVGHYTEAGQEIHGHAPGSVMVVDFELQGQPFTALNGGPMFQFSEAISLQVICETQDEIDYYWEKLKEGGDENAQQCGWLKDRFGVSWQVFPRELTDIVNGSDRARATRAIDAMLQMKKIDLEAIRKA